MKREIFEEFKILLQDGVEMRYTLRKKDRNVLEKRGFTYAGTYLLEQGLEFYNRV